MFPIKLFAFGLGTIATGWLATSIFDDAPTSTTKGAAPPRKLTCAAALEVMPSDVAPEIATALASGTNITAIKNLAMTLESAAGVPGLSPIERDALITLADCLRARADALSASPATPAPVVSPKAWSTDPPAPPSPPLPAGVGYEAAGPSYELAEVPPPPTSYELGTSIRTESATPAARQPGSGSW